MNRYSLHALQMIAALWLMPTQSLAEAGNGMSINEVFRAVISRHPALSGKRAEVSAKEFNSDSARAGRYPSVSGQAGYAKNNTSSFTLRARQPLWAFGRIDSAIAYADADVTANENDLLRVKRDLLDKTVSAYVQVLGHYARRQVAEDNIERHDDLYQQIQRREKGQMASQADVKLAELRLLQARMQLKTTDGEVSLALNELESLAQLHIEQLQPINKSDASLLIPDAEVEAQALEQSTEIHYKSSLVDLAHANVEREGKSGMPTVYLQADRQLNQLGAWSDTRYGVMFEGSLDGMGVAGFKRAQAAGASEVAAAESLKVTHNELVRNVRSLLRNRQLQSEMAVAQKQSVGTFKEILDSYLRQYENGRKAWLEVLNIQRELTTQRLQLVQAENDYLLHTLRLKTLIGSFDEPAETMKE